MKLSGREMVLGWITVVVVLLSVTYLVGRSKVKDWKEISRERETFAQRVRTAERTLKKKDEWYGRLETLRAELPQHPIGKDVTADLLKTLEQTAQDHGLTLLKRTPDKEKHLGDLYEVAIDCTWEGKLESLVHFLYAIHTKGAILDIRQLTVSPVPGQKQRLKGGFKVDCAYSRRASGSGPGS